MAGCESITKDNARFTSTKTVRVGVHECPSSSPRILPRNEPLWWMCFVTRAREIEGIKRAMNSPLINQPRRQSERSMVLTTAVIAFSRVSNLVSPRISSDRTFTFPFFFFFLQKLKLGNIFISFLFSTFYTISLKNLLSLYTFCEFKSRLTQAPLFQGLISYYDHKAALANRWPRFRKRRSTPLISIPIHDTSVLDQIDPNEAIVNHRKSPSPYEDPFHNRVADRCLYR